MTAWAPGWQRKDELPFEPARGYHAVLGTYQGGTLLSVKGAPEIVIPRCRRWAGPSGDVKLDRQVQAELHREVDRLARQGLRVLAAAEGPAPEDADLEDEDVAGLTLLGFVVLSDPIRSTAAAALEGLRRAGVDVVMVTGDHPSTAEGIAVELGHPRRSPGADRRRAARSSTTPSSTPSSATCRCSPGSPRSTRSASSPPCSVAVRRSP